MRNALAALVCIAVTASSAAAQQSTVLKPKLMVLVDTSGSMTDGTVVTNSCGYATSNKMNAAKCTLRRLINSVGDAEFGLGRFKSTCTGMGSCTLGAFNCDPANPPNPDGPTANAGEILVGVGDDNQALLLPWVDGVGNQCQASCASPELGPASGGNTWTPIGGTLLRAREYFLNNMAGQGFTSPITTDRAASPAVDQCRRYRNIMLTDGDETCGGNGPAAACRMRRTCIGGTQATAATCASSGSINAGTGDCTGGTNYEVRTYAIGFGISPGNTNIENLAKAGNTDNPDPTYRGFYASNEAQLSLAFNQIIADSILVEQCNGVDDNCNNLIDEGFTKYCDKDHGISTASLCSPVVDDCDGVDDNCVNGTADEPKNACGSCGVVPTEVCDTVDNDCDGEIDEGGVCNGCVPSAEICDGRDNDCDGRIDEEVTRSCGIPIPPCTAGMQACIEQTSMQVGGAWGPCSGLTPTTEICDGIDNDCDGTVDRITRPCGIDTGECQVGNEECISGTFQNCTAQGATTEVCNNLDDDCDGMIDEMDPGGGSACTSPGLCGQGTLHCVNGALVCQGTMTSMPEVCNNIDDDCDGMTDEGIPDGGACGMPVGGICKAGVLRCVSGTMQCVGYVGPNVEVCNCEDDDCDGVIDNQPINGTICPNGTACIDCQCATPCTDTEFPCPSGKFCQNGYCVADPCSGIICPADADGALNTCLQGQCVSYCSQITCSGQTVCRPTDGLCVPDNCHYFPNRCTGDELCISGSCVSDPCQNVSCPSGQFCRSGNCVGSCADVVCGATEVCDDGQCVPSGCNRSCKVGEVCDSVSGRCIQDRCASVRCSPGNACNPDNGQCEADPCIGVQCPSGQECKLGNCYRPEQLSSDGGVGGGTRVLATGAGGCSCDAAPTAREHARWWLFALLALTGIAVRRKLRRQRAEASIATREER